MDKWIFIGAHYAALLLFALCCWGAGRLVLGPLLRSTPMQRWLAHGLNLSAGIGIATCALQALAVLGLLTAPWLLALLAAGLAAAAWAWAGRAGPPAAEPEAPPVDGRFLGLHWTVWLLLLLGLGVSLLPLRPPSPGDELMYHLPHAREWAKSGRLQINDWLRYPYFPYNYQLLYAAALVLYDDVMPHLLHALAGWTTALLLYQLALRHTTRIAACAAAIAWLALVRGEFGNAYIDMALALFLLAGWIAFMLWWETTSPRPVGWLVLAAFLLGVATGIKYQMLGLLPFFAVAVLLRERRPKTLLLVLAVGLLPCAYWYLRNALLTGDPFNPLGGKLFGFYDWDLGDLQYQLFDLRMSRDWPDPLLWPAAAAPLFVSVWRDSRLRVTLFFCAWAFAVWLFTSHYARYLMPAYPMLLLLAAHIVASAFFALVTFIRMRIWPGGGPGRLARDWIEGAVGAVLILLSVQTTARSLGRDWPQVAATPEQREAFLSRELREYKGALDFLHGLTDARIYQRGMESILYYAPQPIWGDHFGPWRYRDFMTLSPAGLAAKLDAVDLNTIVLRLKVNEDLRRNPEFPACFELLYEDQIFGIYRIRLQPGPNADLDSGCQEVSSRFVIGPSSAASATVPQRTRKRFISPTNP